MKITIKMKLILSFLFIAILAAIIGYIGASSLSNTLREYNELWNNYGMSFTYMGKVEAGFHETRLNIRDLLLTNDSKENEIIMGKIFALREVVNKNLAEFEKTAVTEEEKKLLAELKDKLGKARSAVTKVIELGAANKNEEAIKVLKEVADPAAQEAKVAIEAAVNKNIEFGNGVNKKTIVAVNSEIKKLYTIVFVIFLIGLSLGLFISNGVNKSILQAINEAKTLAESIVNGKLDLRGDTNKINFEFAGIVDGINSIINAFTKPLKLTAEYVDRISKGDMPPKITEEYKGDFNEMKNNLNQCIDAVVALIKDANMLAEAAIAGKLSTRADASKHDGDFRKIVEGVNNTLDAVIGPLNVAAKYVDDISRGDIPEKIKESYNGDFNKIKDNLNQCVDAINELVKDANMLAEAAIEGRLDTRADAEKHKGDFKKIVEGVNNTLDAVLMPVTEARECLGEMAKGNFDTEMRGNYKGDHAILKNALNDTITSINEVLGQVKMTVEQVNSGAGQVSMASQSLSQSSTEAASSLEEISASMQQISSQIKQNSENAVTANQVSNQAKSTAETGNSKMKEMVRAMGEINESAKNISKIIKAIDEIAFQTNLLALNAAVEAARAGKHGKGFTVVAEEVRNLAQRSAKAAKETAEMIEGAISKTDIGTKIAGETAKVLEEIAVGAVKATDLMGEIAAASKEQTQGINQISQGLGQLDNVTQQNTATAEEAASASEELSSQSVQLKEMVEKFNLKNDKKTVNAYVSSHKVEKHEPKKITETKQSIAYKNKKIEKPHGSFKPEANPDKMITLDDNEFGKF
ncbi:MAG: methyl-accepting chemotaxis protein [Candidatus Wallbacteria bacterium]